MSSNSNRSVSNNSLPTKSWGVAVLLSSLFGVLGVDRFYLGCIGTGLLKLFTFGGLGIWALIDFIILISGNKICSGYKFESAPWGTTKDIVLACVALLVGLILPIVFAIVFKAKFRDYFTNKSEEVEHK